MRAYRITTPGDRRYKQQEIVQFMAELNSHAENWHEAEMRRQSQ
jgi:hypothetical protein